MKVDNEHDDIIPWALTHPPCLQPTEEELEAQEAANQEAIRQQEALQVDLSDPGQLAVHDQQARPRNRARLL